MTNVVSKYIEYLKDNPQKYWFRRKVWGWGWTPARWQGWLTLAVFVVLLVLIVVPTFEYARAHPHPGSDFIILYILKILASVAALITVCYATGEPPKWQWGFPEKKD